MDTINNPTFSVAQYNETMQNSYASGMVSTPLQGGGVELSLGPPGKYDQILFQQIPDSGDSGFSGPLHLVQVYTENDEWIGNAAKGIPNFSASGTGLDETYFYGNEPPPPSAVHTGDAPSAPTDNNYTEMTINDTPAMWAIYEPGAPWVHRGAACDARLGVEWDGNTEHQYRAMDDHQCGARWPRDPFAS